MPAPRPASRLARSLRRAACLSIAGLTVGTATMGPASAQGLFGPGGLFGPPRPVAPPPAPVPMAPARPGEPMPLGPGGDASAPLPPRDAGPPPPRPVAVKPVSEDSVIGKELRLNGRAGSLRIERIGRSDYRARLTLAGTKVSAPTQSCTVPLGADAPLTLAAEGRPDGLPRFTLQAPACPISLDVLDGAVLVTKPAEACVIQAADCQAEVRGLWGPEPATLAPQAKAIEQARGAADRAVRENYRVLTQRATPAAVRAVVSEQAAFSSEREQLCRDYAREPAHGFCGARFTEGRALTLAGRLGLNTAATDPTAPRPRRPRPAEAQPTAEIQ